MTKAELIEKLRDFPDDREVVYEDYEAGALCDFDFVFSGQRVVGFRAGTRTSVYEDVIVLS